LLTQAIVSPALLNQHRKAEVIVSINVATKPASTTELIAIALTWIVEMRDMGALRIWDQKSPQPGEPQIQGRLTAPFLAASIAHCR
jgi:hypothetical protein